MKQPTLYMLCGLPGSGKSTVRKEIERRLERDSVRDYTILSSDDHIENMAKAENKTYQEVFQDYIKEATKKLEDDLDWAIKLDKTIIWDQTNLTKKTRRRKLSKIPSHYKKVAVEVYTYNDVIRETNKNRHSTGRSIPDTILEDMLTNWQSPSTRDEEFDVVELHYNRIEW